MSDQENGHSENGAAPGSGADPLYARARTAPIIEGEAAEVPASATSEPPQPPTVAVDEPQNEKPDAAPGGTPRKNFVRRLLAAAAGVGVLGGAGFYAGTEWSSRQPPSNPFAVAAAPRRVEPAPVNAPFVATALAAAPVEAPAVALPAVEAPKADLSQVDPPTADLSKTDEAPPEPEPTAPAKNEAVEARPADVKPVEANADEAKPVESKPVEAKTVEAPPEPVRTVAAPETEKALAEVTARLAATQAALDQVTARLQALEGQLAAPKSESRAPLAERQVGSSNAGSANALPASASDFAARIVAAQSLLAAIRLGDDYAPMLSALENLGGDPDRLARLRAGLSTPNAEGLAKDFAALQAKILAAVAPPAPQPPQEKAPRNVGDAVLTFLQTRTEKLVRIRPADAPDRDETSIRVGRIDKSLARGDIAAALAERAQLPAPALAITAGWAASAQAHLDAELAARAELAAALQGLNKSKS
ncbi:hypothetical protein [uncultured Rhodoblastus sp.]|uniref:hypothetical protein n=1 Tax=uncultured Rhodoblastus sp. TaxID=543037 RepID=UPI0025D7720E|nr:hypothetical protein [uncultured Rhodoblastus sp.]